MKTLADLKLKQSCKVISVNGKGKTRQHLLDMGVTPNTIITFESLAPLKDPMEFSLRGYKLSLRKEEAKTIQIEIINDTKETNDPIIKKNTIHPGYGENGIKYHDKKSENPIDENRVLTFALVGNQNAGKTTLFNQLTGSNQHTGNFPGVTVDRKDGQIRNQPNTLITDLPGIYSMSPYTPEELVSRDFILNEKPLGIINVLDATSIERGLYLTMQLLELDIPMVLALNMMDEIDNNDGYIDINELESYLGIPVVPISASKNEGIDELIEHAIHVTKYQEKPTVKDYCDANDYNGAIHRCLHSIMHIIEDHCIAYKLPIRFCASKCAENDSQILKLLNLDKNEIATIKHITSQMENESGFDKAAAIANMRYSFIHKATKNSVIKPHTSKEQLFSNKIDRVLTGKYTAIPAFILIMLTMFYLSFELIGPFLESLIRLSINNITSIVSSFLQAHNTNVALESLIIDGIFEGIGSVLSFLPIIITMFFFLSLLEDSGYMARVAFFMDKILRKIGLSGRSVVPLLIGFGCSVPAIMASRTLPSKRDRQMTILLTPFMSCSAKLPVYAFFCQLFFKEYAALAMLCLYLLGIIVGINVALIFKKTIFKGEPVPFVMELPTYRLPSLKSVSMLLWDKIKDFLSKAFSIIFIATIIIWFMQNFGFGFVLVNDYNESILAYIANYISIIFKPLGFNDWRISTSIVTGFIAKESVVSTLAILIDTNELLTLLSLPATMSLLTFTLLYTPCIAAISAVKQELGFKYAIFVVLFQCSIAWLVSFIIYNLCLLFI